MSTTLPLSTTKLGLEHAGVLLSPEEFDEIADHDEDYRFELIHGVLVVNAIPLPAERLLNEELGYLLLAYRKLHPQGDSLDLTLPEEYIRLSDSRRRADRVIWAGLGRRPRWKLDVPTIAVEFVSAGKRNWQRDYVDKRDEYMFVGVREYWVIDRFNKSMTVFRKSDGGFEESVVPAEGVYTTPLLPGFELSLEPLLAVVEGWSDE